MLRMFISLVSVHCMQSYKISSKLQKQIRYYSNKIGEFAIIRLCQMLGLWQIFITNIWMLSTNHVPLQSKLLIKVYDWFIALREKVEWICLILWKWILFHCLGEVLREKSLISCNIVTSLSWSTSIWTNGLWTMDVKLKKMCNDEKKTINLYNNSIII